MIRFNYKLIWLTKTCNPLASAYNASHAYISYVLANLKKATIQFL